MSLGIVQRLVETAAHVDTLSKQRSRIGPDDKVQTKQLGHTQIDLNEYFWSEEKKICQKNLFLAILACQYVGHQTLAVVKVHSYDKNDTFPQNI